MKKVIIIGVIIIMLIGLVVYAYVRPKTTATAGQTGGPGRGQMIATVETITVAKSNITKIIAATGAINARAEVEVYPKQTGELVELLVDEGDKVRAGQVLAKIEPRTFEIQVKQAQADLAGATAAYEKTSPLASVNSETNFKQAKSNLDRLSAALKQAELDLILQEKQAEVQIKKAQADLRIAQAKLDLALSGAREQDLEQAKVRVENAKRNLDRINALLGSGMISQDQAESAQLQYDVYKAQLSLLEEGARPEDIEALKAQVEASKASLESAVNNKVLNDIKRSNLEAAKAQLDSAQAAFDQATVAKDASTWEKELAQVEAAVQKAQASLELAQQRLDESIIKAPISGVIAQRFLDRGDNASPTRSFVNIVDIDMVKIIAKIPAKDIGGINVGDKAVITPDAYPGESFMGTVAKISPVIDRASQTCDIEIDAQNKEYKLKPGMFTRVELTAQENKDVIVIPIDALIKEGDEIFVYIMEGDKASKKKVTTGISDGIRTEIIVGLNPGEQLIIAGQQNLKDGMPVSVGGMDQRTGGGGTGGKGGPEGKGSMEKKMEEDREGGKK